MRSQLTLVLAYVGVAVSISSACSFPDVTLAPADGNGGAPTTTTTLAGPTTSSATSTSTSSSTSDGGAGGTTTTSGADGGGGSNSSTGGADGGGGAGTTSSDGTGGTGGDLTGVGGGVTDVMCDNGCIPFPSQGTGGGGMGGGTGGAATGGATTTSGGTFDPDDCDGDHDPNDTDCQPCDDRVNHSQTGYFESDYPRLEGGSSFDYNCSGTSTVQYAYQPNGCSAVALDVCAGDPIYGSPPQCGDSAFLQNCKKVSLGLECGNDGAGSNEIVACH